MDGPRFSAGQSVSIAQSKRYRPTQGAYRVVGAMPNERGGYQYRIKGDLEKYERVIDEHHLAAEQS